MKRMTKEENITLAKRNVVDYIFKSAKMEGFSVTFPETDVIFNGMSVNGVRVDEVIAINNLKRGWHYILDNLDAPVTFNTLTEINRIVGGDGLIMGSGTIRDRGVNIGGTDWKPEMPQINTINEDFEKFKSLENPMEQAIELMLYCMRGQFFIDGNKRSAMLLANKILIDNGQGVISIPIEIQLKFKERLVDFYETGDNRRIKSFLITSCIDGLEDLKTEQVVKTVDSSLLDRKYILTDIETIYEGNSLRRIKAEKDFTNGDVMIKKGDLGGWVQGVHNLSQNGSCWISGEAKVFNFATVNQDALICEEARVFESAKICEKSIVSQNATVRGKAILYANSKVKEMATVTGKAIIDDDSIISGKAEIGGSVFVSGNSIISSHVKIVHNEQLHNVIINGN